MIKKFIFTLCLSCSLMLSAQNIPNPVLPGVADIGVMKYNGKYYLVGTRTSGGIYHTSNLVNWEGPVHAIDMDNDWTRGTGGASNRQINASDLIYLNGIFHLYWSVDYWGNDRHIVHIGHAEAGDPLGTYTEPLKDTWMDSRIDIKVFRDDDGQLYMYMVRFTDGNTIWVRPMIDPRTPGLPLTYQFASLPGTWERMDNKVAEGPWVIKYRNRYYMMYNGNHTGTAWGNYQLGVAEASSPTGFNHGTKYPYPLLLSNQTAIEEKYADVLLFNETYSPQFAYTETLPSGRWMELDYDDTAWKKGRPGFASNRVEGSTVRRQRTEWTADNLYVRKRFTVNRNTVGNLALRVHNDAEVKVFINGEPVYESAEPDYRITNLDPAKMKRILKDGANILTVETKRGQRSGYLDIAMFDIKNETADDILYTPGQPNILRGLNGFEWWLVYMANKNREARSQYINRIHFFGKTMYADNVTSTATKGYFPAPTEATYRDVFDSAAKLPTWSFTGNSWNVTGGEMAAPANSTALLKNEIKASAYLFEAGIKTSAKAGVIVWWQNDKNWLKAGIDAATGTWYFEQNSNGNITLKSQPLLAGFKFGVYHTITVERDINTVKMRIDDLNVTPTPLQFNGIAAESVPGLFAEGASAAFDGVIYTKGWDEFDAGIANWGNSTAGDAAGRFSVTAEGLKVASQQPFAAFKGDKLPNYELSLQIENKDGKGTAGVYPVYIDRNNYISAGFNWDTKKLDVKTVKGGKTVAENSYPLEILNTHYADMKYTDSFEKGYTFNHPTLINSIWLNRVPVDKEDIFLDNMFDKLAIEYLKDGKWNKFTGATTEVADNPMYNRMMFDPVQAESLRFLNREASGRDGTDYRNTFIYKIRVNELFKQSFNFRSIKRGKSVLILVDGKEICNIPSDFPEAQTGIFSTGCQPVYNGILRYHIPE